LLGALLLVPLCAGAIVGCGSSSASTSRADAAAVAAAERDFITAWRRANVVAKARCESKAQAGANCFGLAAAPRERAAEAGFSDAIEKVLADGVGSECAAALEEALAESFATPLFPGDATVACRAESRGE
jgi:hypothetical protein